MYIQIHVSQILHVYMHRHKAKYTVITVRAENCAVILIMWIMRIFSNRTIFVPHYDRVLRMHTAAWVRMYMRDMRVCVYMYVRAWQRYLASNHGLSV